MTLTAEQFERASVRVAHLILDRVDDLVRGYRERNSPDAHLAFVEQASDVVGAFDSWLELRLQLADLERVAGPALAVQRGLRKLLRTLSARARDEAVLTIKPDATGSISVIEVAAIIFDELLT